MGQAEPQESLLHLQRMLEITRRFFEVEAAERRPWQRGGRSYPVPLPVGWRWCLREDAERNRWYHKEYPYGAAARQAD